MCEARFALLSIAKPGTISPPPTSRQGRRLPLVCGNSMTWLCGYAGNLLRPFELGAVDPHAMQNHGELSSNRDFGFAEPASFRDPHAPGFEHRPFCNACQQNACRLVEIASQHWITASRNPSRPVDFTGCIAAARQADISSDTSRPLEARWIIDGREITERSDWADARCGRETSHLNIVARQSHHLAIEAGNLLLDGLTRLEEGFDRSGEFRPILNQLRGAHDEHVHLGPTDDEAAVLE